MKDIPVWVRWNKQELLRIEPGDYPWIVYFVRKRREVGGWYGMLRTLVNIPKIFRVAARACLRSVRESPVSGEREKLTPP